MRKIVAIIATSFLFMSFGTCWANNLSNEITNETNTSIIITISDILEDNSCDENRNKNIIYNVEQIIKTDEWNRFVNKKIKRFLRKHKIIAKQQMYDAIEFCDEYETIFDELILKLFCRINISGDDNVQS